MLDEVDEHGLRPLQVVDRRRPAAAPAARASSSLRKATRVSSGVEATTLSGSIPSGDEHLDERPVRDALAVREAAAAQDVGRVADALEEVGDEARLADAGRPEEREEPAAAIGDRILVVAPESLSFALTADERRRRGDGRAPPRRRAPRPVGTPRPAPPSPSLRAARRARRRTASRTSSRVSGPIRISPGEAACSRRAATLTASPVTSVSPSPPTTTSPVLTPIRASSPCSAIASRISEAARTARSASSSCAAGCRRRPSPHRRRTSRPSRRAARGSRAGPRSSGACERAAPRDPSTPRAPSSRRGRRRGR